MRLKLELQQYFPFTCTHLPFQLRPVSRDYVIEPFRSEINLQIDYARELNPQQLAAVTAPPGPGPCHRRRRFGQDPHAQQPSTSW
jgi:hypothetical protein